MRIVPVIVLLSVLSGTVVAQSSELVIESEEIPEDYEAAVLDLVERYEDMRQRLRIEIQRNSDLYTQEEFNEAIAEVQEELDEALADLEAAENEHKALQRALNEAREDSLGYKAALAKSRTDFEEEVATLRTVIDGTEEESLFQVGPTFSPVGSLGAVGIVNLPQTNVSLLAGTNYLLREQELNAVFGVTFSFLPQQALREGWERLGNRFNSRASDKPPSNSN